MRTLLMIGLSALASLAKAQHPKVPDTAGLRIIEAQQAAFPKFYQLFNRLLEKETLLKEVSFINKRGTGPGFANPNGTITLNLDYFINRKPRFDDNRMVVVLYHEIGHLYYFNQTPRAKRNPEDSEKSAFEYALQKAKEMALNDDCLPLKVGLEFMWLRSQSNETSDAHVRALKKIVKEPLYNSYLAYQKVNCKP